MMKLQPALLVTVSLVLGLATAVPPAHAQNNQNVLRGYTVVNRVLLERIAQPNGFTLGTYFDEPFSQTPAMGDLLGLLGTYVGSDTSAVYRNGDPNSVNMLLWYIAINKLAVNIANYCDPKYVDSSSATPLLLKPEFKAVMLPLCNWPADGAKTDPVLYAFWSALLGFDAPPDEFQAWKTFFLTDADYSVASPGKVVADMVTAALYNPYFLLAD